MKVQYFYEPQAHRINTGLLCISFILGVEHESNCIFPIRHSHCVTDIKHIKVHTDQINGFHESITYCTAFEAAGLYTSTQSDCQIPSHVLRYRIKSCDLNVLSLV